MKSWQRRSLKLDRIAERLSNEEYELLVRKLHPSASNQITVKPENVCTAVPKRACAMATFV
jgi:hypothetical protein